jgi:hypothetical protein
LSASDDPPGDDTAEHFRPPIVDALDDGDGDGDGDEGGEGANGHAGASDEATARFEVQSALDAAQQPRLPT